MLAFDSGVYSQVGEVEVLLLKVRTLESSRLGRPFSEFFLKRNSIVSAKIVKRNYFAKCEDFIWWMVPDYLSLVLTYTGVNRVTRKRSLG